MPTIRHRTGPLAGKEQTIDPRVDRITFGRDPSACDVVFPPDLTIIARRHFAFVRKPSGEWMFEDFGDPFVAINGNPAETDEAVHSGAIVELGKSGGPSFEIILEGKQLEGSLPVTEVQQKVTSSRAAAARARQLAMAGTAGAVAIALAVGLYAFLSRSDASKLEGAVAALQKAQEAQAADSIPIAVRDKVRKAAHVVVVQFASGQVSAQGTASPIAEDLLVTNAHVAELRDQLGPNDKLLVRAPDEDGAKGKVYEVTEVKLHPGYRAYSAWKDRDPIFVTAAKSCQNCMPAVLAGSPSYDVALLRVKKGSNLSPILEVATKEELMALKPGMAVGLAGYPLERIIGSEVQGLSATPSIRTGMITAMTDMFNLPGDVTHRRLVQHNIPVTGGNSGSPMVGPNGKLVALLNAGNVIKAADGGRMPNAAIVNYGQRADLVRELVDGTAEANLKAELAYWTQQTASFSRGFDVIVPALLSQSKPPTANKPMLVTESKTVLTKGDAFNTKDREGKDVSRRQRIQQISLKANIPNTIVAYANNQTFLQLYLVVDGQIVAQDERNTWFPFINHKAEKDMTADVYVVGGDKDAEYRLLQYSWDPPTN